MGTPIQSKTIAIVGAGPGGLTLARLLQMNGAQVQVYERDSTRTARVQGATLNLNEESGLLALRKADLMEEFKAAFRPGAEKLVIVDPHANILLEEGGGEGLAEARPEIDRGPLRDLLIDSLHPGTVEWNCHFDSLEQIGDGVRLHFKNGHSALADLVVATDGANSKLRPYVTSIQPVYSGVTMVEGVVYDIATAIPRIHEMLDGGKICVLGAEKSLFVILKGDGSATFYTGHKTEESWPRSSGIDFSNKAQVLHWFRHEFADWDEVWAQLFEDSAVFVPRPQYFMPVDELWQTHPNLTLLGDAAHVMPPYAGEGVNMAMLDALELAECLLTPDFVGTQVALSAYETKMRARIAPVAEETRRFTAIFHSPNAASHFVTFFQSMA